MFTDGQLLVMGRAGDRTVDIGELAAIAFFPGPDLGNFVACGEIVGGGFIGHEKRSLLMGDVLGSTPGIWEAKGVFHQCRSFAFRPGRILFFLSHARLSFVMLRLDPRMTKLGQSGIVSCFFQWVVTCLFLSEAKARAMRRREECGMITSSMKPRSAATKGLAKRSSYSFVRAAILSASPSSER